MNSQSIPSNPKPDRADPRPVPWSEPLQDQDADAVGAADEETEGFTLPDPDPDNITVLTNKLPNTPILPWNRYDSPGQEEDDTQAELTETELTTAEEAQAEAGDEPPTVAASEAAAEEPEIDEVE
ncbi:MAG: hypothetical protein HC838_09570 [Spirulinaceae cyanobacterium RM2_2_10]|nr:hypothetical protein [Spirulinaceae cyanobacterium SM2_1_0]NJO20238.1 hypothetical protein [Spirulinaceae cyanobacterium RM2_2_10]